MTGSPYEVVTFGEVMALFLADDTLPLRSSISFRRSIAGAEANVAIGLATLGHRVAFAGRLGDDVLGDAVAHQFRGTGVEVFLTRDEAPTGLLIRDLAPARPTQVVYARSGSAGSQLCRQDLEPMLAAGSGMVHVSGITAVLSEQAHEAALAAAQWAHENGALLVIDPNVRLRLAPAATYVERVTPLLRAADVVIAGEEELCLLGGGDDPRGVAAELVAGAAKLVVGKRGAWGAWATDGHASWTQQAYRTPVTDAVGAGDAFAAGIISALLRGIEPASALREAAAVASCVVATAGDVEGLPTARERDAVVRGDFEVSR